ncbi:MAG: hypothetical protein ACD_72C00400G0002 [uncultured bacterium]|nr:MAG: hypothetical protein ACD_72C00400G0002 [uncultured bacterium]
MTLTDTFYLLGIIYFIASFVIIFAFLVILAITTHKINTLKHKLEQKSARAHDFLKSLSPLPLTLFPLIPLSIKIFQKLNKKLLNSQERYNKTQ